MVSAGRNKLGIYIHIPFCRKKCDYCSFYSHPLTDETDLDRYVSALQQEIEGLRLYDRPVVDTVYFGGGTPSLLGSARIETILAKIGNTFLLEDPLEITLECNPQDFNLERFRDYIRGGINRFSMGLQTFNQEAGRRIGRSGGIASRNLLEEFYSLDAKKSVDFITGINPDFDTLSDVKKILPFDPEHLSLYLLSVDQGTPLYKHFRKEHFFEDFQLNTYRSISDYLSSAGFLHYEISNFAKNEAYGRHNLKYWQAGPYIGLGPGAHTFYDAQRSYNKMDLQAYLKGEDIRVTETRNLNDLKVEVIMTTIRTVWGIEELKYRNLVGTLFDNCFVENCRQNEQVKIEGEAGSRRVTVDRKQWPLLDSIIYNLCEFLL